MGKIYKGDIGTKIQLDAGTSISNAISRKIRYRKPSGIAGEWDALLEGTDEAYYITVEDDLDVAGLWKTQLYIKQAASVWVGMGEKKEFTVYDPIPISVSTAITGNYISASEVDNWTDAENQQDVIDRAEQFIERITRDYFYAKAFVKYFDGNANDKLFLGLTPDILTVTEILISGVALDTSWWTYNTDSVYLDPEAATGDDLPELLLRLKYKRKIFPRGMGNIKITGTYGWTSCPVAIKQAAIILCRYENDETLYTKYDDLISDKLGDATQNRGADKKFLTGLMEADRQIRFYIRNKPVMGVA